MTQPWMTRSASKWTHVRAGDVVQDMSGTAWEVESVQAVRGLIAAKLSHEADGKVRTASISVTGSRDVLILLSRETARQLAVAKAQVSLGGRLAAVPTEGGHACPSDFEDPAAILAHLFLFHDVTYAQERPLSAMAAEHVALHSHDVPHPHIHTQRFPA